MATGFPVKANYATGDVLTAANMNDLSGTVNYLQYMPPRNPVLNSAMNVWQRGTSIALAASTSSTSGFTADRWQTSTGANQATTISRQATSDTTNLPNIQYALRFQRNSGQTGTSIYTLAQNFESVNSVPFSGKTITFSFYARAGANYSAASSILQSVVWNGTGTDQNIFSGLTGQNAFINQNATLTTTWQRFTYSATVPTNSTQLVIGFLYTPVGTAGTNDYFEVTGVQLELGSSANTYMPNQPTYQGELAACQRYYWRTASAGANYMIGMGIAHSTTQGRFQIPAPVSMRVKPTSVDTSGLQFYDGVTTFAASSPSLEADFQSTDMTELTLTASGLTQYRAYYLVSTSSSGYVGFSAEL